VSEVAAKYILAGLALAFLVAGVLRLARDGGRTHPQSRTWLLIGAIFGGVSAWLFYQR
jgi:drug/metabolite transporter (DMT)-like permease